MSDKEKEMPAVGKEMPALGSEVGDETAANADSTDLKPARPVERTFEVVAASQADVDDEPHQRDPLPWLIQRLRQQTHL